MPPLTPLCAPHRFSQTDPGFIECLELSSQESTGAASAATPGVRVIGDVEFDDEDSFPGPLCLHFPPFYFSHLFSFSFSLRSIYTCRRNRCHDSCSCRSATRSRRACLSPYRLGQQFTTRYASERCHAAEQRATARGQACQTKRRPHTRLWGHARGHRWRRFGDRIYPLSVLIV